MTAARLAIHAIFALLPVRGYVQPQRPVLVRFATAQTARARRALSVGLRAAERLGGFTAPATGDIITDHNRPLFDLYTFGGKAIAAKPVKHAHFVHGQVNLVRFFPQIENTGTYILTWKNATPLVIETLNNPGQSGAMLQQLKSEVAGMPKAQQAAMLAQFKPVAIHLQALQYARIKTGLGTIDARFYYNVAPHTVENFIYLAHQRFYDGSNFHRIIKNFMIQGGDSVSNIRGRAGTGGPGYAVVQEFNDKPHVPGVLSMARSQPKDSAGSQFFIVTKASPSLNGQYTAFGRVFKGMSVVYKIANTPVAPDSNGTVTGKKPPIISIRIRPATAAIYGIKPAGRKK